MIERLNFVFFCIIRKLWKNNSIQFSALSIQASVIIPQHAEKHYSSEISGAKQ